VEQWLAEVQPDVLCMQETKCSDDAFPALTFAGLGYDAAHHGQGQWNGVAILSRVGLDDVVANFAAGTGDADPDARIITARCGGISVTSVYVPNGRALDNDHYRYKLSWLEQLRRHVAAVGEPDQQLVVLCDWGLVDVFRLHHDADRVYSWWDYRAGDFHQGRGLRIDLVLATRAVAERATWSIIDRNARKGQAPSDHAPVVVDLAD
jgi:exodeoxyribonuclease III